MALARVLTYGALARTEMSAHAAIPARALVCDAALARAVVCSAHPTAPLVPPARIADLVRTQTPVCVVDLAQIILKIQAEFLREISKFTLPISHGILKILHGAWKLSPCKISKFPLQILREILKILHAIEKPSLRKASKIKISRRTSHKTVKATIKIPLMASHKVAEAPSQIPNRVFRRALKIPNGIYR